jgi:hypothetical protein
MHPDLTLIWRVSDAALCSREAKELGRVASLTHLLDY